MCFDRNVPASCSNVRRVTSLERNGKPEYMTTQLLLAPLVDVQLARSRRHRVFRDHCIGKPADQASYPTHKDSIVVRTSQMIFQGRQDVAYTTVRPSTINTSPESQYAQAINASDLIPPNPPDSRNSARPPEGSRRHGAAESPRSLQNSRSGIHGPACFR